MAISDEAYLLDCWRAGLGPWCRRQFPATVRVGSGKKLDGGFCSLGCYGEYHRLSIEERHERRLMESRET